jgi:hypothetical protein
MGSRPERPHAWVRVRVRAPPARHTVDTCGGPRARWLYRPRALPSPTLSFARGSVAPSSRCQHQVRFYVSGDVGHAHHCPLRSLAYTQLCPCGAVRCAALRNAVLVLGTADSRHVVVVVCGAVARGRSNWRRASPSGLLPLQSHSTHRSHGNGGPLGGTSTWYTRPYPPMAYTHAHTLLSYGTHALTLA